jgi:proteasome lid subunit RPN8/RPN11
MSLVLSDMQLDAIKQHGQSTYPEEGGGLLLGHAENGRTIVKEVRAIPNTWETNAERRRRYLIPGDLIWRVEEPAAEARGLEIVGYFHSHPDHPAVPSEFDREHALPNWSYVIVSVQQGRAGDVLAWRLREDRSAFEAQPIATGDK